jgi:hypothetical protein
MMISFPVVLEVNINLFHPVGTYSVDFFMVEETNYFVNVDNQGMIGSCSCFCLEFMKDRVSISTC